MNCLRLSFSVPPNASCARKGSGPRAMFTRTGSEDSPSRIGARVQHAYWSGSRQFDHLVGYWILQMRYQPSGDVLGVLAQSQNLESHIHAVERIPSRVGGPSAQLVPIRFVHANKPNNVDKLMLAFDALVLSETIGRQVAFG